MQTARRISSGCLHAELYDIMREGKGIFGKMETPYGQRKVDIVLEMLRDKLPLETIARISKFSMERVQELGRMHSLL